MTDDDHKSTNLDTARTPARATAVFYRGGTILFDAQTVVARFEARLRDGRLSNVESALADDMLTLHELQTISDAVGEKIAGVRKRIAEALTATDEMSFSCPVGTAALAKAPSVVEITDESEISPHLFKMAPDKAKIGDRLRLGEDVPGARLVQNDTPVLRVRFAVDDSRHD